MVSPPTTPEAAVRFRFESLDQIGKPGSPLTWHPGFVDLKALLETVTAAYDRQQRALRKAPAYYRDYFSTMESYLIIDSEDFPKARLALTSELIARIATLAAAAQGTNLPVSEVFEALSEPGRSTLGAFAPDSINHLNGVVFGVPGIMNSVAHLYTKAPQLHLAFGAFLEDRLKHKSGSRISVKELAAGPLAAERWDAIAAAMSFGIQIDVTMSDYPTAFVLPIARSSRLTLRSEVHNLLDPLPPLRLEDRFDVVSCTYGFDSVVGAADKLLTRHGNRYFELLLRPAALDWVRSLEKLRHAMNTRRSTDLTPEDCVGVVFETALREVELPNDVHGIMIRESLSSRPEGFIWYPGHLIKTVMESFDTQIAPGGCFLIGDADRDGNPSMEAVSFSGPAAFKVVDFELAAKALELAGFRCTVSAVSDFANSRIPPAVLAMIGRLDPKNLPAYQKIMIVERANGQGHPAVPTL